MFPKMTSQNTLPADGYAGTLVGRALFPGAHPGPCVVVIREDGVFNISGTMATMTDLLNCANPRERALKATHNCVHLGSFDDILANSTADTRDPLKPYLLSPIDLHAVKACGMTFAKTMLERSQWAPDLEAALSAHLEIFTKAQPLSTVGAGTEIGIQPDSQCSHSEPEVVLIVNDAKRIVGATLGNDVNVHDREGLNALFLGHVKDNNASCAVGPFIRLFDDTFSLDDVGQQNIAMTVQGRDGFLLSETYPMDRMSRSLGELVARTFDACHHYPDGLALFTGTQFSPDQDRDEPGKGFAHKVGDIVTIKAPGLGTLVNKVNHCDKIHPWNFGLADLMSNLASRHLIG